jgi:hypothetical protein
MHTKVGTFKSQAVSQEDIDETFSMLKANAGILSYLYFKDENDLPMYFAKGVLEDAVVTVERIPD